MGTVTKSFEFDAAHRLLNEDSKCANLHGHRYKVEVTFNYKEVSHTGYAVNFGEIKRICGAFIEKYFDHATIVNAMDHALIDFIIQEASTFWTMGLCKYTDCNPTAENMASEMFFCFSYLMDNENLHLKNIRLYETPTCWVDCENSPIFAEQFTDFLDAFKRMI